MAESLQDLLGELVKMADGLPQHIEDMQNLDIERCRLEAAAMKPRKRVEDWKSSRKLLSHLIEHTRFNEVIQMKEYPKRLLKGDIDLDHYTQRYAVAELSNTLIHDKEIQQRHLKLLKALQLYYSDFFSDDGQPPREDMLAEKALMEFRQDPKRGANAQYLIFVGYQERLMSADKDSEQIDRLDADRPDFYDDLHAFCLCRMQSQELKIWLLESTPWKARHVPALESFFSLESNAELLRVCLERLSELDVLQPPFFNRHLEDEIRGPMLKVLLLKQPENKLRELVTASIESGWENIFQVLTNAIGGDQRQLYQSLTVHRLKPDFFKRMLQTLFHMNEGQNAYGLDSIHMQRVIAAQGEIPRNVLHVLQTAFPRGPSASPVEDLFRLMDSFNKEQKELQLQMSPYENGLQQKERNYLELVMQISSVESCRIITFFHILDGLKSRLVNPHLLGMDLAQLKKLLLKQLQFELAGGRNRNIINAIDAIQKRHPELTLPEDVA